MSLDAQYVIASDLQQYFVDKDTGLPLAAGTLEFLMDTQRITPKTVYQLTGSPPNYTYTPLPNPIVLSGVGTVMDDIGNDVVIYYKPFDADGNVELYYVKCKSSGGVEQFTREAWPNITNSEDPVTGSQTESNQISNPQFTRTYINEDFPVTYTVSADLNKEFSFAPNWDFVISGTGNVIVSLIAAKGNDNIISNPPYLIDVNVSAGITACYLRQRFSNNSGLWSSNDSDSIFLSGTFVARNENVGISSLKMFYQESSGGLPIIIVDAAVIDSSYQEIRDVTEDEIPLSNNTDSGQDGYIDIYLSFESNSHIRVTSIQVIQSHTTEGAQFFGFDDSSSNRNQALLGSYFIPELEKKPIKSLMTAWDFPKNPTQFSESGSLSTAASYIWDQTIALMSAGATVNFSRNGVFGGLQLSATAGTNESFAIIQYLDGKQAKKFLGTKLSMNIFGFKTETGGDITARAQIFRAPVATLFPVIPSTIGILASNGVFTLTAPGWTEIPRGGLPTATAFLPQVTSSSDVNIKNCDIKFSEWEIEDNAELSDTYRIAVVITFNYASSGAEVTLNSVSVCPGNVPARPAEQSFNEVKEDCQFYYEKSTNDLVPALVPTEIGAELHHQYQEGSAISPTWRVIGRTFDIQYNTKKRISVSPILHSTSVVSNDAVQVKAYQAGTLIIDIPISIVGNFIASNPSQRGCSYISTKSQLAGTNFSFGDTQAESYVLFNYEVDCRLGIV